MGKILVYNIKKEDHTQEPNNFYIGNVKKGINPLSNPFHVCGKRPSLKKMSFPTIEKAIDAYRMFFQSSYGKDNDLTNAFNEMYEHYKNGEDIYLQCDCKPLPCHGDVLAEELQKKLIKENIEKIRGDKAGK